MASRPSGRPRSRRRTCCSWISRCPGWTPPRQFLRIHRSYILRLDRLAQLEKTATQSWVAVLTDGTRLPVSRSGYARLARALET
jgi:DNA-binding LytR/AlgR family response regulator